MELSSSYECVPRGLWFGEGRGSGCSCGQAGFYRSCLVFCLIFCRIFLPFGWQSFLGDETAASSMISSLVPPWPHLFGHPSAGNHHSPYIVRHGGVPPAAEGRRSGLRGPCKCWSGKLGRLCSRLGSVLSFLASWKSRKKIEFQMLLRYLWGFFFWFWNKELARIHRLTLRFSIFTAQALDYLGRSRGIERTRELAAEHAGRAAEAIESLPESDADDVVVSRRALVDLTRRVLTRTKWRNPSQDLPLASDSWGFLQ